MDGHDNNMYSDNEILVFTGTVAGLYDLLGLILATMPASSPPAFIQDSNGRLMTEIKVHSKLMPDGKTYVWDLDLYGI